MRLIISVRGVSQDLQTEVPYHLLQLKVEVERGRLMSSLQECQAELARENRSVPGVGSERLIREHRVRLGRAGELMAPVIR